MRAVSLAVRGRGLPREGQITHIALVASDDSLQPAGRAVSWKVKAPPRDFTVAVAAHEVEKMARIAALAAAEDDDEGGQTLSSVSQSIEEWWAVNVGTDRYSPDKPIVIGFRPFQARAWLHEHLSIIDELFGSDQIDAHSINRTISWDNPPMDFSDESPEAEVLAALGTVQWLRSQFQITRT